MSLPRGQLVHCHSSRLWLLRYMFKCQSQCQQLVYFRTIDNRHVISYCSFPFPNDRSMYLRIIYDVIWHSSKNLTFRRKNMYIIIVQRNSFSLAVNTTVSIIFFILFSLKKLIQLFIWTSQNIWIFLTINFIFKFYSFLIFFILLSACFLTNWKFNFRILKLMFPKLLAVRF